MHRPQHKVNILSRTKHEDRQITDEQTGKNLSECYPFLYCIMHANKYQAVIKKQCTTAEA